MKYMIRDTIIVVYIVAVGGGSDSRARGPGFGRILSFLIPLIQEG